MRKPDESPWCLLATLYSKPAYGAGMFMQKIAKLGTAADRRQHPEPRQRTRLRTFHRLKWPYSNIWRTYGSGHGRIAGRQIS
jgi:hypothetical protein